MGVLGIKLRSLGELASLCPLSHPAGSDPVFLNSTNWDGAEEEGIGGVGGDGVDEVEEEGDGMRWGGRGEEGMGWKWNKLKNPCEH